MNENTLQNINREILELRGLLYNNILDYEEFSKYIKEINKENKLKYKEKDLLNNNKDLEIMDSYKLIQGFKNDENIYSIKIDLEVIY